MSVNFFEPSCQEPSKSDKCFGICDDRNGDVAYTDTTDSDKWIALVENPEAKDLQDRRITLLWQPDLKPDPVAGKYIIRFFNSDNARRVRINLEGVTADGKLVKIEKLIE